MKEGFIWETILFIVFYDACLLYFLPWWWWCLVLSLSLSLSLLSLSVYLSVFLSICMYVCMCVQLYISFFFLFFSHQSFEMFVVYIFFLLMLSCSVFVLFFLSFFLIHCWKRCENLSLWILLFLPNTKKDKRNWFSFVFTQIDK